MKFKKILLFIALLIILCFGFGLVINIIVDKSSQNKIFSIDNVPAKQAVLILGAGLRPDGEMSDMLRDRVKVAIDLYKNKKVQKILMSGDHGRKEYDEVNAAKKFILENGVNPDDVFLDHAGFDTYDSLYRAKEIFQAESLIIVTQSYHLPRALYIADNLGIDACGVSSSLQEYKGQLQRDLREKLSKIKAWLDVALRSKPKFLGNPIPLTGKSQASWD